MISTNKSSGVMSSEEKKKSFYFFINFTKTKNDHLSPVDHVFENEQGGLTS